MMRCAMRCVQWTAGDVTISAGLRAVIMSIKSFFMLLPDIRAIE